MNYELYIQKPEIEASFLTNVTKPEDADVFVVGAPLDMSTSYRGGCRWAPRSIRKAVKSLELCSIFTSVDVEHVKIYDFGDVVLAPGDLVESLRRISMVVEGIAGFKKPLVVLGGEHLVTYPVIKALRAVGYDDLCLLVFDAHLDLRDEYLGSRHNHATVMRRILDEGLVEKVIFVGTRAYSYEESKILRDLIVKDIAIVFKANENSEVIEEKIRNIVKRCEHLYVSLDMDVFDPAYAPGVQTPEPLGLTPTNVLRILTTAVLCANTIALDVVELTPTYDPSETTSFLAARIVVEFIASAMLRRYSSDVCRCLF